jgi:colicin import membrane protein
MSIVEERPRSMTETAMARFEAKQAELTVLKTYAALTLADDGIGKVEEAHKAVKRAETEIEKDRVELKSPALEFGRMVDAKAKELQAILDPIEKHLKTQRDIHDAEKLKEKQAKEAAKASILNERVGRLSGAAIVVTDLAALSAMAADEFEFFFAKESRIVADAKADAKADAERLEALRLEEIKRQASELRVRAEEIERQRLADEAVMAEERARMKAEREAVEARQAEERKAMEADRAEMRRQQEEIAKHQAELRAKAEAEAAELRRKEREAEEARKAEAEQARLEALKPEIDKAHDFAQCMITDAQDSLVRLGNPAWGEDAMHAIRNCGAAVIALVVREGV